jgi:peptidyl-prolyl cis-trans isomerase B (cyclophilin B)
MKMRKIFAVLAAFALTGGLSACGGGAPSPSPSPSPSAAPAGGASGSPSAAPTLDPNGDHPKVELTLENGETILMELYPEIAPKSVTHFLENVEAKYYDGKVFHRAVAGFMIQGGSADGNGMGGSGRTVQGEFKANGYDNPLKHTRGVVSLARSGDPNSASGQFFIMHDDYPSLDGNYAAFGKVLEGMEVVDAIAASPVGGPQGDQLETKPVIKSIRVKK